MSVKQNPAWAFSLDKVYEWAYWDNAFSKEECDLIIAEGLKRNLEPGTVTSDTDTLDTVTRKSKISWIAPTEETKWLYQRLTDIVLSLNSRYFNFDLFGITEHLQFTEYKANYGHYVSHVDRRQGIVTRKLSMSVQLTDPKKYKGGELLLHFDNKPIKANPEQGALILFPSYTLHEVTPVTKGTRHSLVAWVTGKNFI